MSALPFTPRLLALGALAALAIACNGDKGTETGDETGTETGETGTEGIPQEYAFTGRDGGDSVSYGGQVFRQLLIDDMARYLGDLTGRLDSGSFFPTEGEVTGELNFYYAFDDSTSAGVAHGFSSSPPPAQSTYGDVSSDKDLTGKIAGNDATGQHKDWSTELVGWDASVASNPEALVEHWFAVIDAQAVSWANGEVPLGPDGAPLPAVYVTPEGQDLKQLLEKFLRGAVAYSQGADDYLDDDIEGKGLLADHSALVEGKSYTALEHAWDEGFGYFGAAQTYPQWTDDAIADDRVMDADGDGAIDLLSEVCVGHSVNAAKRDRGAVAAVDYTAQAWEGFAGGRQLLAETDGALTADELSALRDHRDLALDAWERSIASSAVHYINDVLQDMGDIGTPDYSFADHAKHWGELKGFALSLQFNPHSPLTDAQEVQLHDLLGTAPVLEPAGAAALSAYADDLIAARTLLGTAYGFDAANLGDENGENGW